jgi:transglutaminase-like putative cysteine protease
MPVEASEFLDVASPAVAAFVERAVPSGTDQRTQAVALYYAVRDKIRYDVYGVDLSRAGMRASYILQSRVGFCIHKAIVYVTAARYLGIPCRLGFSDVRNHLSTGRLRDLVGGDVFCYHARAEVCLDGRWVKLTPVFNASLCRLFGVPALDFDGYHDSISQPFDASGEQRLQTLRDHGTFEDFPYAECVGVLQARHPKLFASFQRTGAGDLSREHRGLGRTSGAP